MAGERIMEALDIADVDRQATLEYEEQCRGLTEEQAARVPQPVRPPLLVALGIDGPQHVLKVVEKVPGPALFDALLVLPFTKVVSMLTYLDEWAKRVSNLRRDQIAQLTCRTLGYFDAVNVTHLGIPPTDPPPPNRGQSSIKDNTSRSEKPPTWRPQKSQGRGTLIIVYPLAQLCHDPAVKLMLTNSDCVQVGYNLAALRIIRRRDDSNRVAEFYESNLGNTRNAVQVLPDEATVRAQIQAADGKKRKRVNIVA